MVEIYKINDEESGSGDGAPAASLSFYAPTRGELSVTSSLTPPGLASHHEKRLKALNILGFSGALIMLSIPFIPIGIKVQLLAGYGLSVGATAFAAKIGKKHEKQAEFIRGVVNFCLLSSLTSELSNSMQVNLEHHHVATGLSKVLATSAAKPVGAVVLASKQEAEFNYKLLPKTDVKSLFGVILEAVAKGLVSPYFIGLILHTGKYNLPVFVIYVTGRTVLDLAFKDRPVFTDTDYIREISISLTKNSLNFAFAGIFDVMFSEPIAFGVKNITSSSLAGNIVTNINAAMYYTTTDIVIIRTVNNKIKELFTKHLAEKEQDKSKGSSHQAQLE